MPDAIFSHPRLAGVYDALEGDRSDLDTYLDLAAEARVNAVLDVGCGTGTLACLLAARGVAVLGVDPAPASVEVARSKPGAGSVRWIHTCLRPGGMFAFETHSDGGRLDSTSTLRFRTQGALRSTLAEAGFGAVEIRDLPYAPNRGWLVLATA
ncbi:methyltransferase domain-containing protein [Arthrobacter caoxuetaonis]|uniref:Methyltransferase domain-containing protein n=1 Tax=Arthrobacter caoxuetaonis TaxID=2886935 RepID=A0A9X1SBF9_9MICC|nr:methyltransferase domain-containing protein [Arthrobacter caoxuetaonis]MCC3297223.1 methyltransferase domain-containing protein [Arthrobacter caoxuetaonis]USQ58220.1 methyltransferase domain-containing protein [Arthrobacter caoxuetaonis]